MSANGRSDHAFHPTGTAATGKRNDRCAATLVVAADGSERPLWERELSFRALYFIAAGPLGCGRSESLDFLHDR
jgi:hypothetical protein